MNFDISEIALFSFDFDGTLVQSNHIKAQAFIDTVLHHSDNDADIVTAVQNIKNDNPHFDRFDIFKTLEQKYAHLKADILSQTYGRICEDKILQAPEVNGALTFLSTIKKQKKYVIVNSATPKKALENIIEQLDIKHFIDGIYGAPQTKTQNIIDAIDLYKVNPKQVLVIGDGENDKEAAKNTGCPFFGLTNEYSDLNPQEQKLHQDYNLITTALKSTAKQFRA